MKVMITGSNGQLGRELANQLGASPDVVLFLTDIDELDITDMKAVMKTMEEQKPDVVVNCAAYTNVDKCEDDEENARDINAKGAGNLADAAKRTGAAIVHISTDYVFDGLIDRPYAEDDITNPQSIYGITKLEGERAVMKNNPRYYIIRTAWLYGDGKNFVRTMMNLAKKRDTLRVVDDQLGTPTSTRELAGGIIQLLDTDMYGIYHGTCEGSCTWYDFAVMIFKYTGIDIKVERCTSGEFPQKAKRPAYSVLDNRNFRERLGYRFKPWEEALMEYIREEIH